MMARTLFHLRLLTSCAVILALTLIGWQCIDLYLTGSLSDSQNEGIHQVTFYHPDDISLRFEAIKIPLVICLASIVICFILHAILDISGNKKNSCRKLAPAPSSHKGSAKRSHIHSVRIILYIAAIAFVLLGIVNGGLRDVLIEAIAICTECIGLG